MAVLCPRCGRNYDVTLFAFGRTIWCTCGSRVGLAAPPRGLDAPASPKFLADAMLAKLARWLRLLGFDCAHDTGTSDERLVRRSLEEQRVLLTLDRRLPEEWTTAEIRVLRGAGTREQLVEVVRDYGLADAITVLSRCSECNCPVRTAAPDEARERVPPHVLRTQDTFRACPRCGRVYWEGTHAARIRRVAEEVLEESVASQAAGGRERLR